MKKIVAIILAVLLLAALTGCQGGGSGKFTIGICQIQAHPALDQATKGFQDALTEQLGADKLSFQLKDAGGDYNNCATIMDGFVVDGVDLILANATNPLQAAASATSTIPILGTSVTDYATALGIEGWTGTVGKNISGTSDLAPLDQQAAMIQEMFPDAENVGLLYCSTEPNSVYQINIMKEHLTGMGYICTEFSFADVNELQAVTENACTTSDVIYIPTDNTAAAYPETIANVVIPAKVPVIAGESGICSGCGVATLSIDYYDLGYATGLMAAKILKGEADISTMPVEFAPAPAKMYNPANCEALGITPPADYAPLG